MSTTPNILDYQRVATAEYRYWLHDPDNGIMFFRDPAVRDRAATYAIDQCRGEAWAEEVTEISIGQVTHLAGQTQVRHRPAAGVLEETGEDPDGVDWDGIDYLCDYEMLPLDPPKAAQP